MNLYIEYLSFFSLSFVFRKKIFPRNSNNSEDQVIYFIDASRIGIICIQLLGKMFGVEFHQLKFKMMDFKDENGELVRIRIPRKDIFEIQKKIIHSEEFHQLFHPSWKQARLEEFLKKGITSGGIKIKNSSSRILYLINVIYWHNKNNSTKGCLFVVNRLPWFNTYKEYASNFDIKLFAYSEILKFDPKKSIKQLIIKSPYLYIFCHNLKYRKYNINIKPTQSKCPK